LCSGRRALASGWSASRRGGRAGAPRWARGRRRGAIRPLRPGPVGGVPKHRGEGGRSTPPSSRPYSSAAPTACARAIPSGAWLRGLPYGAPQRSACCLHTLWTLNLPVDWATLLVDWAAKLSCAVAAGRSGGPPARDTGSAPERCSPCPQEPGAQLVALASLLASQALAFLPPSPSLSLSFPLFFPFGAPRRWRSARTKPRRDCQLRQDARR
jgi:hypothetical protein